MKFAGFMGLLYTGTEPGTGTGAEETHELSRLKPRRGQGYFRRVALVSSEGTLCRVVFDQVTGYWPDLTHLALYESRSAYRPYAAAPLPTRLTLTPGDRLLLPESSVVLEDGQLAVNEAPLVIAEADSTFVIPYRSETVVKVALPQSRPPGQARGLSVSGGSS